MKWESNFGKIHSLYYDRCKYDVLPKLLRADVISTRGGKNKTFEKSHQNFVDYPTYSSNKNITLSFIDKYFGETANVKIGRLRVSARPLFRALRPGYEKTAISIEFKYNSTQKAPYRVKRVLIHILSGHVREMIASRIFYGFSNIYKTLRILREQNIVKFQRPKITSDT